MKENHRSLDTQPSGIHPRLHRPPAQIESFYVGNSMPEGLLHPLKVLPTHLRHEGDPAYAIHTHIPAVEKPNLRTAAETVIAGVAGVTIKQRSGPRLHLTIQGDSRVFSAVVVENPGQHAKVDVHGQTGRAYGLTAVLYPVEVR